MLDCKERKKGVDRSTEFHSLLSFSLLFNFFFFFFLAFFLFFFFPSLILSTADYEIDELGESRRGCSRERGGSLIAVFDRKIEREKSSSNYNDLVNKDR